MRSNYRFVTLFLAAGFVFGSVGGCVAAGPATNVKPHSLFSSNMVVQRGVKAPVWGTADAGGEVTVSLCGQSVTALADKDGKWIARLKPLKAGGPHKLKISGKETITLDNVMIGEVWICSGQSNMEQGISACANPTEEIANAKYPNIRLFMVPHKISGQPQKNVDASWKVCSPTTIAAGGWGGFSGAGYYFGRHLNRELKVPIGLIQTCWGGTIAEAWTSAEALSEMPDFKQPVKQLAEDIAARKTSGYSYEKVLAAWWRKSDPGSAKGTNWAAPSTDVSAWKTMDQPAEWNAGPPELKNFDGLVWFRRDIDVPTGWAGKDLTLELGPIDDRDTTFFNGVKVGGMNRWSTKRKYSIPGKLVKAGKNVLAVRVLDIYGKGGLYGKPQQLKLSPAGGGKAVSLAGKWRYRVAAPMSKLGKPPVEHMSNPNVVTVLYNGMLAPLPPFGVAGAIWYQGESNAGRPMQYRRLLPTMIADWRNRFGVGKFPFLVVQLASFMSVQTTPVQSGWAELREAQLLTERNDPKVGMSITTDIGAAHDIHPKNKQDVGKRLALAALAIAYDKKLVYSGPVFRKMKTEGAKARLAFDHVGGGLVAKGGKLKGFAIAGQDGKFAWADAVIDGREIVVSSPEVPKPTAVRYNWANNPIGNLYNKEDLPAGPFRSDVPPTK
jgi:sialate O-acetylesterase